MSVSLLCACAAAMLIGIPQQAIAADASAPGATQVAPWKDNKKAAFLLMFDDNAPSHLKNAIPELKKRNFTGTFYVCPGKGWSDAWKKEVPGMGMEYGNHTNTHSGAKDAEKLDEEIKLCAEAIDKAYPDRKTPRLISWGQPGTGKGTWLVTNEQVREACMKYNLIDRGPFMGAAIHYKNGKDMVAVVDKAISSGSAGYIVFHGVGGDWLSASMPDFLQLLDYLVSKQDQIWVTDHISSHKYATERAGAEVKVVEATDKKIQLALTSKISPRIIELDGKSYTNDKADPKLYDAPLTLITKVPASWQKCQITQGAQKTTATAANGTLQYEALPNSDPISIQPATL
ncbi:MAG: hypothetical protein A2X45_11055 [Lentisphaerae bacterium GWF2_50_93]|nr:MAG: hypothetical protein A2X45_11055 [Lentisphaerae bacterium GWF2_50_93]